MITDIGASDTASWVFVGKGFLPDSSIPGIVVLLPRWIVYKLVIVPDKINGGVATGILL